MAWNSILAAADPNHYLSLFTNVQSFVYWSGTGDAPTNTNAWLFYTDDGFQNDDVTLNTFYAWAVRSGDVAAPVPLPAAVWLFVSGLIGLGVVGRARRR